MGKRARRGFSRREFLQTAGAVAGGVAAASLAGRASAQATPAIGAGISASIEWNEEFKLVKSAPLQWAAGKLRAALTAKGITLKDQGDLRIVLAGLSSVNGESLPPETLRISRAEHVMAAGSDSLGLVYAITELADRVEHAKNAQEARAALLDPPSITESPTSKIRSIFRMFSSEREDKGWFHDREGWQKYFDMLVTNRFNRFNLSFGLSYDFSTGLTDTYTFFMYPFFVDVPGYSVRAIARGGTALPVDEQKKNLDTLKFISDQAALRGLQFNLGIWTHNYRWANSPNATHTIEGLNAETQAPYSRDAMKMLIQACPGITGITLRTHGESGVPEGSYDLWKIIFQGIVGHKNAYGTTRVIELDLHGKTMTKQMIDTAESTGQPVTISCKFWAEHLGLPYMQSSIRESEMPRAREGTGLMALSNGTRSFLRYGIGDLLQKGRKYKVIHRVWPGTQRLLLWGDPLYAAEYGKAGAFAGMDGIEYFEPLSFRGRAGSSMNIPAAPDRSGYADNSFRSPRDWEKYNYTFRLWGRLSYNPNTAAETWQRQLKTEFRDAAGIMESALSSASRILPLITTAHLPAAANFQYYPEIYLNQSIHTPGNTYSEAPMPRVFGNVSSLDPQIFATINEYADSLLTAKPLAKISPLDVARQLDAWCASGAKSLEVVGNSLSNAGTTPISPAPVILQAGRDTAICLGLGQFFAHKFRAAILWQLFNLSAHEPARAAAIDSYKKARDAWAKLADTAKIYLPDLTFGPERQLRRHWSDRLADIDNDIAGMATRAPNPRGTDYQPATIDKLVQSIVNPVQADREKAAQPKHVAAKSFKAGDAMPIALEQAARFESARLLYRHLHQGERYTAVDMQKNADSFAALIPADFTNSAFPVIYYFELRTPATAEMFPGFGENFVGTPYFVVPPA